VELNGRNGKGCRNVDAIRDGDGKGVLVWEEDRIWLALEACPDVCAKILETLAMPVAAYGAAILH
jgi:hypothetical protein